MQTLRQAPVIIKPKKKKKVWPKILLGLIFVLILFYGILFFLPVNERADKPYFQTDKPLILAHQGGELLAPSNTVVAFDKAVQMGVEILELDIHMTKDGHLVVIHDSTVDRTTNGSGRVDELTLNEIQSFDGGYSFKDLNGNYSYRDQDVYIPTLEELFQRYGHMRFNIEIKDTYPKGADSQIELKLWELIQKYNLEDQVLVVSFQHDIVKRFDDLAQGRVAIAGGSDEVRKLVILHKLFLNRLYKPSVDAIQIPTKQSGINLVDKRLIKEAEKMNMQVHYWTINDEQTMRQLLELGAHGIITDRPDMLLKVRQEYLNKNNK